MKSFIEKSAAVLMAASVALTACTKDCNSVKFTEAEKAELLEKAYVFTLPLMLTDATFVKMTNTVDPKPQQSPANQFIHARKLANASSKDVVTPNADTNYSQIMMDLSGDPLVVRLPRTDRFCMAEILDAWSNCIAAPDATTIEGEYGYFVFIGPRYQGTIPARTMTPTVPWIFTSSTTSTMRQLTTGYPPRQASSTFISASTTL